CRRLVRWYGTLGGRRLLCFATATNNRLAVPQGDGVGRREASGHAKGQGGSQRDEQQQRANPQKGAHASSMTARFEELRCSAKRTRVPCARSRPARLPAA